MNQPIEEGAESVPTINHNENETRGLREAIRPLFCGLAAKYNLLYESIQNVCMTDHDPVKKPKHYNFGRFEVIDVIEDWKLGYHLGNVTKYIARAPHKGEELQDLRKARWYLERKIWLLEIKNGKPPDAELRVEPAETK